ncbi:MAG: endonuclease/exonuclease/phosphatase family protein [Segetibacter sp.]|nr:endonuclease/exonuclease/phosphatase family protein [Segetibacter sp.]
MKIATWNIARPSKSSNKVASIINQLREVNADILILTETIDSLQLGDDYKCFHSSPSLEPYFKEGERRVSIYSKYEVVDTLSTFNNKKSICISLATELGELAVYGTIMGTTGNRDKDFMTDVQAQINDFQQICQTHNLSILYYNRTRSY